MKENRRQGRFFSLLIKNYILFTAVNVALVILTFSIGSVALAAHLKMPEESIDSQLPLLKAGHYDKIKQYKLVGSKGYFEILDENYRSIYISDPEREGDHYTKDELNCMPDYITEVFVDVQKYKDENGKQITSISGDAYYDVPKEVSEKEFFIVIDEDRNVVHASPNITKKSFTEREYNFLVNDDQELYISKYAFVGNDGKTYTMIVRTNFSDERVVSAYYRGLTFIGIAMVCCYIMSILGFVMWLTRKVKKPLKSLNDAMVAFAAGDREQEVDYSGAAEFVQICDSFNNMADQLKGSEEAKLQIEKQKQKMLADISHDLKTPITTIQGYAKALADGIVVQEDQQKYLNRIYAKSIGLTELINTFYEYSKLEHPDFTFTFSNTEINEFLREYLAGRYEEIIDKKFELELEIPEVVTHCETDRVQLRRALDNILNNALKHNPEGTIIFVKADLVGTQARIVFADNGVGISEDMARIVFEAFAVGDESRNTKQGSGLGLSICKKIVEGHGGTVKLLRNGTLANRAYNTAFEILIPVVAQATA